MEIVDKYGSHYVPADYFTRGDHIENDHIHFPTGVETHNVASDAELLTAVQQLEAQVNTKADQTTLQSQGAVLQQEIDANELTHQNDVLGLQGEIDTNETNIAFNTQKNQEHDNILQYSTITLLAQDQVRCNIALLHKLPNLKDAGIPLKYGVTCGNSLHRPGSGSWLQS